MTGGLKRILLVEDSAKDVELTLAALDENHLANEVVVVRDGAEALEYLHRKGKYESRPAANPGVVLLDLKMPKVDGIEVLKVVKADDRTRRIPVVVMTSSHEQSDVVKTYDLGVNSYVVKPVDFTSLADVIRQAGYYWLAINRSVEI